MAPSLPCDSVFVGRQREMAELTIALEDALSGRGRLVMLVGEPGIGKTRISQELARLAEQRGGQGPLGPVLRRARRAALLALGAGHTSLRPASCCGTTYC